MSRSVDYERGYRCFTKHFWQGKPMQYNMKRAMKENITFLQYFQFTFLYRSNKESYETSRKHSL